MNSRPAGALNAMRAETELAEKAEQLRLAQLVAYVGTWHVDLRSGDVSWSDSVHHLLGVGPDLLTCFDDFLELVHEDDRVPVVEAVGKAREQRGDGEVEFRFCRPDGGVRWLLARGRVLDDDRGHPVRMLGVVMDVSERREAGQERQRLEHRLRQTQKLEAVGRLAGGVAHDFNNLLLAIRGYGELALRCIARGEDAAGHVNELISVADRATGLTRQLLTFSRRQMLKPETIDLTEVVAEMEKLLRRLIGEDVEIETQLPETAVHITADRGQLEQVLANLVVNARDAMPEGGRLSLQVRTAELADDGIEIGLPAGTYALLRVGDTGCGMNEETAAHIFEPFFTTKDEGNGLGLATVHGIVQQSGGAISVDSSPGHGTCFRIYLPLTEEAPSLPSPEIAAPVASSGETILLVEDDPQVRAAVRQMLESWSYQVVVAASGEEALELAPQRRIDLLLTDLVMPGLGGRQLAERLAEVQPQTAVLYVSGYSEETVVGHDIVGSEAAFLEKPFSSEELARRVRQLLDRRREPAAPRNNGAA